MKINIEKIVDNTTVGKNHQGKMQQAIMIIKTIQTNKPNIFKPPILIM